MGIFFFIVDGMLIFNRRWGAYFPSYVGRLYLHGVLLFLHRRLGALIFTS